MTFTALDLAGIAAIAALLALLTFILRLVPRLLCDPWLRTDFPLKGDMGDSMVHLLIADLIRQNDHRIMTQCRQFVLGIHYDYPSLFHKLVSYVPKRSVERWDFVFTPIIDALHVVLVFFASLYVLVHLEFGRPVMGAAFVAAGFLLTPLFLAADRRPAIGERPLGFLFGHAFVLGTAMVVATGSFWWFAFAIVAGSCAAATSKFAIQAMVFISAAMALLTLDVRPLASLACTALFAVLVSRGYVVRVTRGLIRHATFYARELMHYQDYVNSFGDHMLAACLQYLARGRVRMAWRATEGHPIGRMLRRVPWLLPFAIATWLIATGAPSAELSVPWAFFAWGWASILVGVATSMDAFKFLGEGFRYLEFGIVPMVLSVLILPPAWQAIAVLCILALSALFVWRQARSLTAFDAPKPEAKELVDFFASRTPCTIFAVPGRMSFPLCYGTKHRAVWHVANVDVGERGRQWASLFARTAYYPFPDPASLSTASSRFGADVAVIWKDGVRYAEKAWGRPYVTSAFPLLFENARYLVIDLTQTKAQDNAAELSAARSL